MPDKELKIDRVKVADLVKDFDDMSLAVPEFQRDYIWAKNKAALLVDSLYRNFPISVILLWETEEDVRNKRNSGRTRIISWIVDGQQRVTTLSEIFKAEGIEVVFNPSEEKFQIRNRVTDNSGKWYLVSEVLNPKEYRQINASDEILEKLARLHKIQDYEVPVIKMIGHSIEEAQEAFQRINQYGTRLKVGELYAASIATVHKNLIASKVTPLIGQLRKDGFSNIGHTHLFHACEFIVECPKGKLYTQETKKVEQAWEKMAVAVNKVRSFIKEEYGVENMDILKSGSLLVPAIALHYRWALSSPAERDYDGLAGWLALASIHRRYSGASETALEQDLKACRSDDPIGNLLSNLRSQIKQRSLRTTSSNFGGFLQDKGALFAAYIACRYKGHKSLVTLLKGKILNTYHDIQRHHIFPRAKGVEGDRRLLDTIANIAFISTDENKSLSDDSPSVYLHGIPQERLESNCIPTEESFWSYHNREKFWENRRKSLAEAFNDYIKSQLPRRKL